MKIKFPFVTRKKYDELAYAARISHGALRLAINDIDVLNDFANQIGLAEITRKPDHGHKVFEVAIDFDKAHASWDALGYNFTRKGAQ